MFFKCKKKKEKEEEKDWYLSDYAKENWEEIHIDLLNKSVDQAEKYLQATMKTSEVITARSYQIFGFLIPLLTLTVTYCISTNFADTKDIILKLSGILISLVLGTSIYYCTQAMKPHDMHIVGNKPKDSLDERFIKHETPLYSFLINECDNYQYRIEENAKNNRLRASYIKQSIFILFFIPLSPIVSWLVSLIFPWLE